MEIPSGRFAVAQDAERVRAIARAAYAKYTARKGGREAEAIGFDYGQVIGARELHVAPTPEGDIAGFARLVPMPEVDALAMEKLAVDPELQRGGYGLHLLMYAEGFARERDLHWLRIFTDTDMTENIELYRAIGFEETHRGEKGGFERVFFEREILYEDSFFAGIDDAAYRDALNALFTHARATGLAVGMEGAAMVIAADGPWAERPVQLGWCYQPGRFGRMYLSGASFGFRADGWAASAYPSLAAFAAEVGALAGANRAREPLDAWTFAPDAFVPHVGAVGQLLEAVGGDLRARG